MSFLQQQNKQSMSVFVNSSLPVRHICWCGSDITLSADPHLFHKASLYNYSDQQQPQINNYSGTTREFYEDYPSNSCISADNKHEIAWPIRLETCVRTCALPPLLIIFIRLCQLVRGNKGISVKFSEFIPLLLAILWHKADKWSIVLNYFRNKHYFVEKKKAADG